MQLLTRCLRAVLILLWIMGLGIYLFCVAHSVTLQGRAGLTGLALVCSVVLLCPCCGLQPGSRGTRRRLALATAGAVGLLLMAPLPLLSPSGMGGHRAATVEHVYLTEQARPWRFSVSWMVPEVDQILMGVGLARWVDATLGPARALRLRSLCQQIYRELGRDPAFRQLGTMLGAAHQETLGAAPAGGHYLAMVPRTEVSGRRIPLVVFLHGSAGNFASYWKVLAPLARRHRVAVICPTFGFGNWYRPGGVEHVLASIIHARRRYPAITGRTYLVGLSNGGTGVSPAVARCKGCFAGVAYISGVIQDRAVRGGVQKDAWRGLPVLVIHGHRDRRIPPRAISSALRIIKRGGAKLSRLEYPGEDHFLFFAKREQVLQRLVRWVGQQGP